MVDYKFILEVARHGARAPTVLYDLTAPGVEQFPTPMELTEQGAQQHYDTGKWVLEKFFKDETLTTMAEAKIYAQSTGKNRTQQSATSQLQGIFGTEMTFPELEAETYPLVVGVNQDGLILTDGKNCERFDQVEDAVSASNEWKTLFEDVMPNDYLNENVYDWLREQTGEDEFDLLEMSDLATYVFTATYGGLELKFPVSDEHYKWSSAGADQFVYEWLAASDELW